MATPNNLIINAEAEEKRDATRAVSFLGFEIRRKRKEPEEGEKQPRTISVVPPLEENEPGYVTTASGHYGQVLDVRGDAAKTDRDLLVKYRNAALQPECDSAIEDIVNEAIVADDETIPVQLNLDLIEDEVLDDKTKDVIREEFDELLRMLDFRKYGHDIFRRWYIDGKIIYHKVVDLNDVKKGIQDIRPINPIKIQKVTEVDDDIDDITGIRLVDVVDEYFVYSDDGFGTENQAHMMSYGNGSQGGTGVKLSKDSVCYVTSGLTDATRKWSLSYLHKALKTVNQLRMMEDALVIYRLARAPERRVFSIDIGDMSEKKGMEHVRQIMNQYRNKIQYDAKTGEVRQDGKHMCLSMDTKVPLLDGRTLTLTEITEEHNSGKKLWVYSCDPITGKFEPGLVSWAGVTRKDAEVMKLTLDNGKTITCTPDHKFPVWNKGFIRADELTIGESMVPHYTKKEKLGTKSNNYEMIFQNELKDWEFTHRLVSVWKDQHFIDNEYCFNESYKNKPKTTVHHININPSDNTPENLVRMDSKDHFKMHGVIGTSGGKLGGLRVKELGKGYFNKSHPEYREWHVKAGKIGGAAARDSGASHKNYEVAREVLAERMKDPKWNSEFRKKQKKGWTEEKRTTASEHAKKRNLSQLGIEAIKRKKLERERLALQEKEAIQLRNHKIVNIEILPYKIDTGCLTVDGDEIYHSHHTFALEAGIYTKNSMLEDFWIPTRNGAKGTQITTLPGGENLGAIDDLVYFQKALYKALNVPVNRLDNESGFNIGRTQEISRDELKFQKFIHRLRVRFGELFKDLLKTQLILKEIISLKDWDDFKENIIIDYAKDSYFSELKDAEILRERITSLQAVETYIGRYFSEEYVYKQILKMDEDAIKEMRKQMYDEAIRRRTQIALPSENPQAGDFAPEPGAGPQGGEPGQLPGQTPEGEGPQSPAANQPGTGLGGVNEVPPPPGQPGPGEEDEATLDSDTEPNEPTINPQGGDFPDFDENEDEEQPNQRNRQQTQ